MIDEKIRTQVVKHSKCDLDEPNCLGVHRHARARYASTQLISSSCIHSIYVSTVVLLD